MELTLITPVQTVERGTSVKEVTVPAQGGELNILPGHAALMTSLRVGKLHYVRTDGTQALHFVAWGYCQVVENKLIVLCEILKSPSDIDKEQARINLSDLEKKLSEEDLSDTDFLKVLEDIELYRKEIEF